MVVPYNYVKDKEDGPLKVAFCPMSCRSTKELLKTRNTQLKRGGILFNGIQIDLVALFHIAKARQNMRVFTPEQLYRNVWHNENDDQVGAIVKSAISALRKKLKPYGRDYIQNVWRTGYRFVGKWKNP